MSTDIVSTSEHLSTPIAGSAYALGIPLAVLVLLGIVAVCYVLRQEIPIRAARYDAARRLRHSRTADSLAGERDTLRVAALLADPANQPIP